MTVYIKTIVFSPTKNVARTTKGHLTIGQPIFQACPAVIVQSQRKKNIAVRSPDIESLSHWLELEIWSAICLWRNFELVERVLEVSCVHCSKFRKNGENCRFLASLRTVEGLLYLLCRSASISVDASNSDSLRGSIWHMSWSNSRRSCRSIMSLWLSFLLLKGFQSTGRVSFASMWLVRLERPWKSFKSWKLLSVDWYPCEAPFIASWVPLYARVDSIVSSS